MSFCRIMLPVIIRYLVSMYLYFVLTHLYFHILSVCLCFYCSMQQEVRSYFLMIYDNGG
mgnify:CR=1 FL=1